MRRAQAGLQSGSPITVRLESDAEARLVLTVENLGPGTPLEERERVFERIHRVERTERRTPGAGLGLSIVSAISRMHSARCSVENQPPVISFHVLFERPSGT